MIYPKEFKSKKNTSQLPYEHSLNRENTRISEGISQSFSWHYSCQKVRSGLYINSTEDTQDQSKKVTCGNQKMSRLVLLSPPVHGVEKTEDHISAWLMCGSSLFCDLHRQFAE